MHVAAFLDYLRSSDSYEGQIEHIQDLPEQPAAYADLAEPLGPELQSALESAGISRLYRHQARAIELCRSGKNAMVVTPAASGKTVCYNVPVLEAVLADPQARALYLFPTKALAQDQMRALQALISGLDHQVRYDAYDGDTPQGDRPEIRKRSQIVLTNPDMLHSGILPNHGLWSRFWRSLAYVVVDEAHVYRGIFGSHVANVLRRLRRICGYYRASPRFVCCSATIANAQEHAENLVGLPFEVVDEDGSPHGPKKFIFWNPPLIGRDRAARRSPNSEAAALMAQLVSRDIRTLVFTRSRRLTELVFKYARERLAGTDQFARISSYRAGYLPSERREIEHALFQGKLTGVVATVALELGIDIGSLDATVLTGYPGSVASTWQQAGRSGRRATESLSVLIGVDGPLDQYIMRHPDFFFGRSSENALINPGNPYILKNHLLCAAWELPLGDSDARFFDDSFAGSRQDLERDGLLKRRERQRHYYLMPPLSYPAETVNIRSASATVRILDASRDNRPLDSVEAGSAIFLAHPGAIYLHRGESYLITSLDLPGRLAYALPSSAQYYTQAKEVTQVSIRGILQKKTARGVRVCLGRLDVTSTVTGFSKRKHFPEEVIGEEPLDLPPQHIDTVGLWFDIPQEAAEQVASQKLDFAGALHAAEHAAIGMLPLFALCDRNDIGGLSTVFHPDTAGPQIFIYDAHPGGTGIAEKGFELVEQLWQATLQAVAECPCQEGCPGCIQSPKCGNNNNPLDKAASQIVLRRLLRLPMKGLCAPGGPDII